jgi:hypothetical protein
MCLLLAFIHMGFNWIETAASALDRAHSMSACMLTRLCLPACLSCLQNYPLYAMLGIACGLATYMPFRHLTSDAELA